MGNSCCQPQLTDIGSDVTETKILIAYDPKSPNMKSYSQNPQNRNEFKKVNYNWHNIPIRSEIDWSQRQYFMIENVDINKQSFVVGIIRADAATIPKPWTTDQCICYESHTNTG